VFDLIERPFRLSRDVGQTDPHQHGAGDMVSLDACLAALATLKTRELLELAMKLLDLPAQAARVLCRRRGILSEVVGHNPVRAVCRHLDPEQLHFVVFGKALDFDRLAVRESLSIPLQRINMPVGRFAFGVVDQPVAAQRAVVGLAQRLDEQHQILRGVPRIHQDPSERQLLVMDHVGQHVTHVIEFGFAVTVRIVNAVIDDPVFAALRIHVEAVHYADALDDAVSVAAVLPSHQLDLVRKILVGHGIVEHDTAVVVRHDLRANVIPHQPWRHVLAAQKSVDGIVAHIVNVIGKVRQRAVGRTRQQVLAVAQAAQMFRHALDVTKPPIVLGLRRGVTNCFRAQVRLFA